MVAFPTTPCPPVQHAESHVSRNSCSVARLAIINVFAMYSKCQGDGIIGCEVVQGKRKFEFDTLWDSNHLRRHSRAVRDVCTCSRIAFPH